VLIWVLPSHLIAEINQTNQEESTSDVFQSPRVHNWAAFSKGIAQA
jgi:hypothetical protein